MAKGRKVSEQPYGGILRDIVRFVTDSRRPMYVRESVSPQSSRFVPLVQAVARSIPRSDVVGAIIAVDGAYDGGGRYHLGVSPEVAFASMIIRGLLVLGYQAADVVELCYRGVFDLDYGWLFVTTAMAESDLSRLAHLVDANPERFVSEMKAKVEGYKAMMRENPARDGGGA